MDEYRQSILADCFEGVMARDCGHCDAHPTRGGTCCFGAKFAAHDAECRNCIHSSACAVAMRPVSAPIGSPTWRPTQPRRIPVYGQPSSTVGSTATAPSTLLPAVQPKPAASPATAPAAPKRTKNRGFRWNKFFQFVKHGMGEGGLQMGLNFMQLTRPDPYDDDQAV